MTTQSQRSLAGSALAPKSAQERLAPAGEPPEAAGPMSIWEPHPGGGEIPEESGPSGALAQAAVPDTRQHASIGRTQGEIEADNAWRAKHRPDVAAAVKKATDAAIAELGLAPKTPRGARR